MSYTNIMNIGAACEHHKFPLNWLEILQCKQIPRHRLHKNDSFMFNDELISENQGSERWQLQIRDVCVISWNLTERNSNPIHRANKKCVSFL